MNRRDFLRNRIKKLKTSEFDQLALDLYLYQYDNNSLYRKFCDTLKGEGFRPKDIYEIPFLPVSFFKSNSIVSGDLTPTTFYKSSSTTGINPSIHAVVDNQFYLENALKTFESFYGNINEWVVLALLPGYIERGDSSLIAMTNYFIKQSKSQESGFYLNDFDALLSKIYTIQLSKKILLLGVSFALQELAKQKVDLSSVVVMETGGMKGKGKEMPKKAFHNVLKESFNIKNVHSEYGMTELLSQGYSKGNGIFSPSNTMKVISKELTDPLSCALNGKSGIINIIDLMNIDSCAFIETQDMGIVYNSGDFELLGRVDASEIRGCNLLVSEI